MFMFCTPDCLQTENRTPADRKSEVSFSSIGSPTAFEYKGAWFHFLQELIPNT